MAKQLFNNFTDLVWKVKEDLLFKDDLSFEFHSLVFLASGEMKVIQADRTYVFGPGSMLLFPRNQISTVIKYPKDGKNYESVVFRLTIEQLKSFYASEKPKQGIPDNAVRVLKKHPLLESFFSSVIPYFDLENKLPENLAKLKLQEAITVLRFIEPNIDNVLADFSEPGKINLVEFMEINYRFNLPLEKFGYLTGRSLSTFNRDFRKIFNMTPQRWLTKKRLESAYFQLSNKNRKPTDVYLEVGFENLSHFSSAFKKQYGHAPSNFV